MRLSSILVRLPDDLGEAHVSAHYHLRQVTRVATVKVAVPAVGLVCEGTFPADTLDVLACRLAESAPGFPLLCDVASAVCAEWRWKVAVRPSLLSAW